MVLHPASSLATVLFISGRFLGNTRGRGEATVNVSAKYGKGPAGPKAYLGVISALQVSVDMNTSNLEQACGMSAVLVSFTDVEEHLGGSLLSSKSAKNQNLEGRLFFQSGGAQN